MRSTTVTAIAAGSLLALGACGQSDVPDDFGHTGTGINFNMGALTYPGAADVCYSFTVVNGLDQLVVGRGLASTVASPTRNPAYATWRTNTPYVQNASYTNGTPLICSTQFGNGPGGDWSYVAPCDASEDAREHTVTVWLDLFLAGTAAEELTANVDYQDPCPAGCSVDVTCQENADTPVSFNFTIMRRANQGFFDIGVNFDDVFCSAKLDSCHVDDDDNVTPIGLLFDGDGRNHTAVAAVACSAGPEAGIDTTLYMSNFVVTCPDADGNAGGTYTLDLSTVDQEGRLTLTDPGNGNALEASVFFGEEALPGVNKVFTNIAFLLPDTGEPCFVNWTVVPTEGEPPPEPGDDGAGSFTHVAAVIFDAPEGSDDPGAEVQYGHCHAHKLNGEAYTQILPLSAMNFFGVPIPSGVFTVYATQAPSVSSFIARRNPVFGAPPRCKGPKWDYIGNISVDPETPPPANYECIRRITGLLSVSGSIGRLEFSELAELGGPGPSLYLTNVPSGGSTTLAFPKLERIHNQVYKNNIAGFGAIEAPGLRTIDTPVIGYMAIGNSGRVLFNAPELQSVAGDFVIEAGEGWSGDVGRLSSVRGLYVNTQQLGTWRVDFPNLSSIRFLFGGGSARTTLGVPKLATAWNPSPGPSGIYIGSPYAVAATGSFTVEAPMLTTTSLLRVTSPAGDVTLNMPALTTILTPPGGPQGMDIAGSTGAVTVTAPSLTTLPSFRFANNSGRLQVVAPLATTSAAEALVFSGNSHPDNQLTLGIAEQVSGLTITNSRAAQLRIENLRELATFEVNSSASLSMDLPDLESVSADLIIQNNPSATGTLSFILPALVEANVMRVEKSSNVTFSALSLASITTRLEIITNKNRGVVGDPEGGVVELDFPALVQVGLLELAMPTARLHVPQNKHVVVTAPSLQRIEGQLNLSSNDFIDFHAPAVDHVRRFNGGLVTWNKGGTVLLGVQTTAAGFNEIQVDNCEGFTLSLPRLTTNAFSVRIMSSIDSSLIAPVLPSINNFTISNSTGNIALESVTAVSSLFIANNPQLEAQNLLIPSLRTVSGNFGFFSNPLFSQCAINKLLSDLNTPPGGTVTISGNLNDTCD